MMGLFTRVIVNKADAREWVKLAAKTLGLCFHPDTAAADYVRLDTGEPCFCEVEAELFEANRRRVLRLLDVEVYAVGLDQQLGSLSERRGVESGKDPLTS